ncbi:hypothetical protein [Streptomyces sp. MBT84]|uniref:hypothetical protein n=1 Tax=Streptomyces sp. MBT84 TaxID=1488414 RepID=UPI001C6EA5A1|nr:hypothetical protein [Streptomyces sp. MBT84]
MARQLDARRTADLQDDEYRSWAYEMVYCRHGEILEAAFADLLRLRQLRFTERALESRAIPGSGVPERSPNRMPKTPASSSRRGW